MNRLRWIQRLRKRGEAPEIDAFLEELVAVCQKHGFRLGHEDGDGAFKVHGGEAVDVPYDWLLDAEDARAEVEDEE